MRKLVKSMFRFSWAMTLLGARTMVRMVTPRRPGEAEDAGLGAVAEAASDQLDGPLQSVYEAADQIQSQVVDRVFDAMSPAGSGSPAPRTGAFDASTFVVLGDGLAAGMNHFSLEGSAQATSFPAFMAKAMGAAFHQPLFQAPGLGDVIGLEPQMPIVPGLQQTTVLGELPGEANLGNLSVPGFGVHDALDRRPRLPLVDRESSFQTLTNFILGLPDLMTAPRGRTQLEYARHRDPTLFMAGVGRIARAEREDCEDTDPVTRDPPNDHRRALLQYAVKEGSTSARQARTPPWRFSTLW